jgi:hypothetical protein
VTGGKNFGGRKGQLDLEIFSTSILCVHPEQSWHLQKSVNGAKMSSAVRPLADSGLPVF